MIRVLLLDFDGTLVRQPPFQKLRFLFRSVCYLRQGGVGVLVALKAALAVRRAVLSSDGKTPVCERSRAAFCQVTGLRGSDYEELLIHCVRALPLRLMLGAEEFLRVMRESNFSLVLATNPLFSRAVLRLRLRAAGLNPEWFCFVTSSEDMCSAKPSPDYFMKLPELCGVKAGECLMVGNDHRKDLPAIKAGIPVLLLQGKLDYLLRKGKGASYRGTSLASLRHWILRTGEHR